MKSHLPVVLTTLSRGTNWAFSSLFQLQFGKEEEEVEGGRVENHIYNRPILISLLHPSHVVVVRRVSFSPRLSANSLSHTHLR